MRDTLKRIERPLAVAIIYALAYLVAWGHSADQFFLPAGLRIAALLLLPYRLWPAVFVGDATALMMLRVPIAEQMHTASTWPFVSSILVCPLVSIVPLCVRRLWPTVRGDERWVPLALLCMAAWGVASNTALNALLGGPDQSDFAAYVYRYSVGQYLAVLVVAPPALLFRRLGLARIFSSRALSSHVACAVGSLLALFVLFQHVELAGAKLAVLAAMLLPPIFLAFLSGWRGAAIGVAAANLAIGFSMGDADMGNKDTLILVAQQALAVVGSALLVVGSTVSREREKSARLHMVEKRALQLAMNNHLSTEQALRDRAESIARAQKQIDDAYRDSIRRLKAAGQYELAMQLTAQCYQNTQMLFDQAAAIYPMHIERSGLYAVLRSSSFAKMLEGSQVRSWLQGDLSGHGVACQLAAYRSICHAIEMMPAEGYRLSVRAWTVRGVRGMSVRVNAQSAVRAVSAKEARMAEMQLCAKMQAYGGAFKRRRASVFFVLGDGDQFLRSGTMVHATPFAPLKTLTTKSAEL